MREVFENTIERLFGDLMTPELIRRCEDGAWSAELWNALEDTGVTLAAASEERGGAGASWEEIYVLVRSAGSHAVPAPFPEALLANWLLSRAGLRPYTGALAFAAKSSVRRTKHAASGRLMDIPWGRHLGHVVAISADDAPEILVLEVAGASGIERKNNIAREPRDDLTFDRASIIASAPLPANLSHEVLLLGGAMLRCAQIAGALHAALEMTSRYAGERVQFGKPIAGFQAVQQQLAVFAEHTASSLIAAEAAFSEAGDDLRPLPIIAAKVCAGEAAGIGASIAHAVHGAIGFTAEHGLHLITQRLWGWRSEYGSQSYWARRLGRSVCSAGSRALWPLLTEYGSARGEISTEAGQ
jgi:acyl-CoA dehydrogenase